MVSTTASGRPLKSAGAERGCERRPAPRNQSSSRKGSGLGSLLTSSPILTAARASMGVSSGSGAAVATTPEGGGPTAPSFMQSKQLVSAKLKQEEMTKSLIGSQESADQARCGTNWTAGTNQTSSCTDSHKNTSRTRPLRNTENNVINCSNTSPFTFWMRNMFITVIFWGRIISNNVIIWF